MVELSESNIGKRVSASVGFGVKPFSVNDLDPTLFSALLPCKTEKTVNKTDTLLTVLLRES